MISTRATRSNLNNQISRQGRRFGAIPMLNKTLLSALLISALGANGLAATVTLQSAADTSLFETNPDSNLGASDLAAGTTDKNLKSRALIRFNLTGEVPANATVTSATLGLRVTKEPPSAAASTFGLHRVLQEWGEGTKTGIVGDPASAGEATWKARLFPATLWSAPGAAAPADYIAKASATRVVAGLGNYTFASTADLVADAQAWLVNPNSNFGWILISQAEATPRTARRFGSSEDPATAPTLTIEFTVPAQATSPTITAQPQNQTVAPGASVSFAITANGTAPLSYQWKFNDSDVAGATNPTLTLSNVQAANAGSYSVVVSNAGGSVTSSPAALTVTRPATPPSITQPPQPQTVDAGANVTFTVVATGDAPLSYQWKFNGVDIPGATASVLSLSSVQASNGGSYSATVSNPAGSVTSPAALLSVRSLPPPSRNRWTIMIYGHADHNLSGSLVVDMQEMEAAGSGPDFNIVLQADFDATSERNAAAGLPADLAKGVSRFLIQKDSDPNAITTVPVERLAELNLDDPAVLTQFITWAAQKYPADRYGLVMWNHGGQWQGFGGDSQDGTLKDKGILSTAQIRQAVSAAMQTAGIGKWEFIAFDTCLMGGAEVLTDFVPLTDVFIACPEIDYGDGWEYEATFNFLKANPAASALDFGRAEVKAWEAHHMQPGKDSDLALAAHGLYDLTKYAAFEEKFNAFSALLSQTATPQNLTLPRLRLDTTQYSLSGVKDIGKPTDYIDLGELADRLVADPATDAALKAAATSLVASIDTMVVAKVRGTKKQQTHGLSAYYPVEGAKDNQAYLGLAISSKPGSAWSQFLTKVTENEKGDTVAPDIAASDVGPAGLAQPGNAPTPFSASLAQPASLRVKVVNGADSYAMFASIVDNHFTTKTNEYVYLGEVLYAPVQGVGTYNIQWNGALPMLSNTAGTNSAVLGGFFEDVGSDILVSFAQYTPPGSAESQFVALLTQISGNKGKVIEVLDAEVEDLAPRGVDVKSGGKLTPIYYLERRQGDDPDNWESDDVLGKASIVIPQNGLAGLTANMVQLPSGIYTMEVQVIDAFENESEVLEYLISVGQPLSAPRITVQALAANRIKITWPGSASDYTLEANTALSATGWTAVPSAQIISEGANRTFTDTAVGPTRFYRLRRN
jgi:hypothetical protein